MSNLSSIHRKRVRVALSSQQKRFAELAAKYCLFLGGRGSGKTYILARTAVWHCLRYGYNGAQYFVGSYDLPVLKRSILPEMVVAIAEASEMMGFDILLERNKQENFFVIYPGVKMWLVPVYNYDKLRGATIIGYTADEVAIWNPKALAHFNACLRDKRCEVLKGYCGTTWKGRRSLWLREIYDTTDPEYAAVFAPSQDWFFLPKGYVKGMQRTMSAKMARQELGCDWTVVHDDESSIYPEFDIKETHGKYYKELPEGHGIKWFGYWAIDWGHNAMHATYWIQLGRKNRPEECIYICYDEIGASRISPEAFIARIKAKEYPIYAFCPDPQHSLGISLLKRFQRPILTQEFNRWARRHVGEDCVRSLMLNAAGEARMFFNLTLLKDDEPRHIIRDTQEMRYKEDRYNPGLYIEKLDPGSLIHTHSTDTMRYMAVNVVGAFRKRSLKVVRKGV